MKFENKNSEGYVFQAKTNKYAIYGMGEIELEKGNQKMRAKHRSFRSRNN
jgi:hypothetical protein